MRTNFIFICNKLTIKYFYTQEIINNIKTWLFTTYFPYLSLHLPLKRVSFFCFATFKYWGKIVTLTTSKSSNRYSPGTNLLQYCTRVQIQNTPNFEDVELSPTFSITTFIILCFNVCVLTIPDRTPGMFIPRDFVVAL